MANEKKVIKRSDWQSSFNLIGEARVNDEYTFKLDEHSDKSNWIYNSMNLGVFCGEKSGVIYCDCMGGYSADGNNVIYVHGKKDDGSDDFEKQITVDWEDRFNPEVLEEIGEMSFVTVGLEKTSEGKTYYKKFLSTYDAIAYAKEHLSDGMVINIRGNLKYSEYNGNVQVRKNITSIALSKAEDSSKYKATFIQSVLLDKDSASLKDIDKDKSVMYVNARVLDYVKEINGVEVRGQYPYYKQFEFPLDLTNEKMCKTIYDKLFKVKKNVRQVTFEGELIEGGAVITATLDDLPQDIQDLVAMGIYSEEEACAKCTVNGSKEKRMVLKKPTVKLVGEDKVPVLQVFDNKYTEDDLVLDYLTDFHTIASDEELPFGNSDSDDGDLDWLSKL